MATLRECISHPSRLEPSSKIEIEVRLIMKDGVWEWQSSARWKGMTLNRSDVGGFEEAARANWSTFHWSTATTHPSTMDGNNASTR